VREIERVEWICHNLLLMKILFECREKSRVALGICIGLSTIFATSNALMTTFAQVTKNVDFNDTSSVKC
jgi:hypothetical protein